jgi:hypothetical protein
VFDIDVRDGVVSIRGRAETRTAADMIERLIAIQPGVIAVHADIAWIVDDGTPRPPDRELVHAAAR